MEMLKKFFPYSFGAQDVAALVIKILVYIVVGAVAGFIIGLLGIIPIIRVIFSLIGALVELYVLAGVVIAVLDYLKILK
jgi:hypothetical protein